MNDTELFNALSAAARRKGKPLTDIERIEIVKGTQREVLRERFLKVIRGAGYVNGAPEKICNEWLDKYMLDIPKFVAMLENYERNDYDPD